MPGLDNDPQSPERKGSRAGSRAEIKGGSRPASKASVSKGVGSRPTSRASVSKDAGSRPASKASVTKSSRPTSRASISKDAETSSRPASRGSISKPVGGSRPASRASRVGSDLSPSKVRKNSESASRTHSRASHEHHDDKQEAESPERTMSPKEEEVMKEEQELKEEDTEKQDEQEVVDANKDENEETESVRRSSKVSIPTVEKIDPEDFDSRSFLESLAEVKTSLESETFRTIDASDYPAEELTAMVTAITTVMDNFKHYSIFTQKQMEGMREQMKDITNRMHKRIQQRAYDPASGM